METGKEVASWQGVKAARMFKKIPNSHEVLKAHGLDHYKVYILTEYEHAYKVDLKKPKKGYYTLGLTFAKPQKERDN